MNNNEHLKFANSYDDAKKIAVEIIGKDVSFEELQKEGYIFNSNKDDLIKDALYKFIEKSIKDVKPFKSKNKADNTDEYPQWHLTQDTSDEINAIRNNIKPGEKAFTLTEWHINQLVEYIREKRLDNKRNYELGGQPATYQRAIAEEFKHFKCVAIFDSNIGIDNLETPDNIYVICVENDNDNKNIEKEEIESQSTTVTTPNNIFGRNIILYGAPGTGKSYTVKQIVKGEAEKTYDYLSLKNFPAGECVRVTFHPDTDYASFVGCYKPSMNGKEIEYKFVPQAFLRIYVDAWKNLISEDEKQQKQQKQQYYLVIEELNRGNCAQIFGDIFQLLDRRDDNGYSEYYILADTDVVDYLKSADGFGEDEYNKYTKKLKNEYPEGATDIDKGVLALPYNLTILATMNTSDQSLFPIDSAFKRRWEWKYVRINYEVGDLKDVKLWDGTTEWLKFIKEINKYIADKTHSADKQIGERFIKKPKDSKIDYETFRDKVMFYLFNDVFKDDESFGKDVFEDENGIHLFGDLTEENAKEFIKNKLLVQ